MQFQQGAGTASCWPLKAPRILGLNLSERLKSHLNLFSAHAYAGIGYFKDDVAIVAVVNCYGNRAARFGEFDGVGQKVDQDLLEPRGIGSEEGRVGRDLR